MHEQSVFIFLELQLLGLCVHNHDARDSAAVSEAASMLHDLIHNVDGSEWLTSQFINMFLFKLVKERIVEDKQYFVKICTCLESSVWC